MSRSPLLLMAACVLIPNTVWAQIHQQEQGQVKEQQSRGQYVFDKDVAGAEECNGIKQFIDDDEEWRLWCINEYASMQRCGLMCHEALHFPPSDARCRKPNCNFSSTKFVDEHRFGVDIGALAEDKAVILAVVPTWESYSNYMLAMLEKVRMTFPDSTEAMFLPLDIAVTGEFSPEKFRYQRGADSKVLMLEETRPAVLGSHPLYRFLSTLRLRSGGNLDIFTDRPVVFVIGKDGIRVERMVFPSLETLEEAVSKLGGVKNLTSDERKVTSEF